MLEKFLNKLYVVLNNRLYVVTLTISIMFLLLLHKLFYIQIIQGEYYRDNATQTIAREIVLPAPRGNIFDRYGRPLATNDFAFSVKIDPSITMTDKELNIVLLELIHLLKENDEEFIDTLPITTEAPFEFTFSGENSQRQEELWKSEFNLDENLSAEESLIALKERFNINQIDRVISMEDARNIVSIRANMFSTRFRSFNPITISTNVSLDTVTTIEEENERFRSIFVATETSRHYPAGETFSHILGFTGSIPEDRREEFLERGYGINDSIGRSGLEMSFEDNLRGQNGSESVIVNNMGRRVGVLEGSRIEPIPGDDIFLSVDKQFQQEVYDILENMLTETIINMLTSSNTRERRITVQELLSSLTKANNISAIEIFESEPGSSSYIVKQYVLSVNPEADPSTRQGRTEINNIIGDAILSNNIRTSDILIVMYEQEIITGDENFVSNLRNGAISPLNVVINRMRAGEITPQMTNLDPSTGSVIVVDVKSGEVLASVSYPSYDNNQLVNNFNNDYYTHLLFDDPTLPLINRPFMEMRPPGSTFKMITGIAGLETGAITPNTLIHDNVTFTRAGNPAPSCWHSTGHGSINVAQAIAVSCNYFFFETAFRMGNHQSGNSLDSIEILNEYMKAFGLNERSGVELGEAFDTSNNPSNISSPDLKYFINSNTSELTTWLDGDTIRTAIGQSFNNYTAANMVKYTMGLATRGQIYDLRFLRSISPINGEKYIRESTPFDMGVEISDTTWDVTHEGMVLATQAPNGTARNIFSGFPIPTAGKTGTAQQNPGRREHTSFNAFAPYYDPQIAVYVVIPFSNTLTTPSPATQVGRDVIGAYFRINEEAISPIATNTFIE